MEPEIHYRVHKIPSIVPALRQTNPMHDPTTYLFKIRREDTYEVHINLIVNFELHPLYSPTNANNKA